MKKIVVTLFLAVACLSSWAQTEELEYRPFVENGKKWIVLSADYRIWYTKTYYIDGDTIFGNQACKKLMLHYKHYVNETETTSLYCCIYEENKKVYYFPADAVLPASPILLYDFNVTTGDTVSLGGQRDDIHSVVCYRVWQDKQQDIKGEIFRVLLATENDPSITYADANSVVQLYKWYEGIGSRIHPFVKKYWNRKMGGMGEYLYECKVNNRVIYFDRHGGPLLPNYDVPINAATFPDENFRNWVLAQSYGQDGILTVEEIAGIKEINVRVKNIQSLKGIEYFTELTTLYCTGNQLTELDVSECTKLTDLECAWNQLATLDVSKNTALVALSCSGNQLTALDVSQNIALETLGCGLNMLTSLDVSQNTMLTELYCQENQLTELDVTKNIMLKRLGCPDNQLTSINILGHTELESLRCARNNLTQLDVSGCPALNELICMSNQIKGEAMDALVESLPTVNRGHLGVINHIDEQNVMTKSQVAAAKAKGWYVHYNNDKNQWQNYEGSDDGTGLTSPFWKTEEVSLFDLQGRKVSNPKKGIYIEDGRKVLIK